jgi:hypothetical protein
MLVLVAAGDAVSGMLVGPGRAGEERDRAAGQEAAVAATDAREGGQKFSEAGVPGGVTGNRGGADPSAVSGRAGKRVCAC